MHRSMKHTQAATIRAATLAGLFVSLVAAISACSPAATSSQSVAPTPGVPSPPAGASGGASAIVLERAPADIGCDSIGVDYRSFTIRIDPSATPNIWAQADTGTDLQVRWDPSFTAGDASNPVIMDKDGTVVAEDGIVVELPAAGWPELEGHFICTAPSSIIVLDQPAPSG